MKDFKINQAYDLADYYKYLIGKTFSSNTEDCKVTHVSVVPCDSDKIQKWFEEFNYSKNYKLALSKSGFDPNKVAVKVFTHYDHNLIYKDLDDYLTEYSLDKIYVKD
jgi:hypothetical protein